MQINRACKYVVLTMISTVAFTATAHADVGYQPYYYSRDDMQFSRPSVPPVLAPVAVVAPAQQQRAAIQFSDTPTVIPVVARPMAPPTVFTSDPVREPVQFTNRPMATQAGEMQPVVMHPAVEEDNDGPSMDMSAGLGW